MDVYEELAKVAIKIEGACKCDTGSSVVAAAFLIDAGLIEETTPPAPAKTPPEPENSSVPHAAE